MRFYTKFLSCIVLLVLATSAHAQFLTGSSVPTNTGNLVIHPVSHASFVMGWDEKTIYVDPVGGVGAYDGLPRPDLILVTDIHGDHLDAATLAGLSRSARIIAPAAVVAQLPDSLKANAITLANGGPVSRLDVHVEAVPMYNLTEDRLQFHAKGRGNGYIVTMGGTRIYISGDTEDIPEMRALENIDVAFVCFNLPYTMTEDQAASAVREFAPDVVYPYHFGESDVAKFSTLVGEGNGIEVRLRDWY